MKAFLFFCLFISLGAARAEITIDSSGTHGHDGTNGSDGHGGFGAGGRGGDAGDGTPGGHGTNARNQRLRITDPNGKEVRVEGTKGNEKVSAQGAITGGMEFFARGGNGGKGGNGGRGGHGAQGYSGRDATESSSGTNGGPGGAGGHGGDGKDGGAAGAGAIIELVVPFEDLHVLSLVRAIGTGAGTRGERGHGGGGGSGGAGGPGGSSHSWETYTYHTESGVDRRERADGSVDLVPWTKQVKDTHRHSNPGGSNGSPGSPGGTGSSGRDGASAPNGRHAYIVEYPNGTTASFQDIYNLAIEPYDLVDASEDGIFEPGESGTMTGVIVRNPRLMPTPPPGKSQMRITIRPGPWFQPSASYLELPVSLDGGKSHPFDRGIGFALKDVGFPDRNRILTDRFTVSPRAVLTPTQTEPSDFYRATERTVQFPIQLRLEAPIALAQGEKGRVRLIVTNISKQTLGGTNYLGDRKDDPRRLVNVLMQDELGQDKPMHYFDGDGKPVSLRDGMQLKLEGLQPGESRTLEGFVSVPEDFEADTDYRFHADLNLGKLDVPTQYRPVQEETHRISVARRYATDPNADIGLIKNGETNKAETDEWERVLQDELGFRITIWDAGNYGNLDLIQQIIQDPKWNLGRDLRGKSVIMLNNESKWWSADRKRTWAALSKQAFQKLTAEYETSLCVIGTDGMDAETELAHALLRTEPGKGSRRYANMDALLKGLEVQHRARLGRDNRPVIGDDFHKVRIVDYYWGTPKEADLDVKVQELDRKLRAQFPDRRYAVSPDYHLRVMKKGSFGGRDTVDVGDLIVQRLPDATDRVAIMADMPDEKLRSPAYIVSDENLSHVIASLSAVRKVMLLDRMVVYLNEKPTDVRKRAADILVDELVEDIVLEYDAALKGAKWRGQYSPRTIARLKDWRFENRVKHGTPAGDAITRLYTRAWMAGHYAYSSVTLWGTHKAASDAGAADLHTWAKNIFDRGEDYDAAYADVSVQWAELMKKWELGSMQSNAHKHGVIRAKLKTEYDNRIDSQEVFEDPKSRIVPWSKLQEMAAQDLAAQREWESFVNRNVKARAELKLPPTTANTAP